jgi:hypothetical protein
MDWGYITGFFDGEGNINIIKNKKKNSYYIQIRLYSTNKEVLEKIKEYIKMGNVITRIRKNPHHNPINELTITNKKEANLFLKNVRANCIIKKKIVEYLLSNFEFNYNSNAFFDISKIREFNKRGR